MGRRRRRKWKVRRKTSMQNLGIPVRGRRTSHQSYPDRRRSLSGEWKSAADVQNECRYGARGLNPHGLRQYCERRFRRRVVPDHVRRRKTSGHRDGDWGDKAVTHGQEHLPKGNWDEYLTQS